MIEDSRLLLRDKRRTGIPVHPGFIVASRHCVEGTALAPDRIRLTAERAPVGAACQCTLSLIDSFLPVTRPVCSKSADLVHPDNPALGNRFQRCLGENQRFPSILEVHLDLPVVFD